MIPSTYNSGNEPIISWPSFNDITTQSKEDNHFPLSLINFPTSPLVHCNLGVYDGDTFLQNHNDLDLLFHHQQPFIEYSSAANASIGMMEGSNRTNPNDESAKNPITETDKGETKHIVKKKSSKNDRHSKINTAQGPRDRRMRLSLEVARQFFDLQDMLGFDKASRTIEWLLFQSKSAIIELVKSLPKNETTYAYTTTEQELSSEFDEMISNGKLQKIGASKETPSRCSRKEKKARYPCKLVARESRKKARERARERTMEKLLIRGFGRSEPGGEAVKIFLDNNQQQQQEQSRAQDLPGVQVLAENKNFKSCEEHKLLEVTAKRATDDDSLEAMCKWSPCYNLNYQLHDSGIFQEHQSRDLQMFLKPWEATYKNL